MMIGGPASTRVAVEDDAWIRADRDDNDAPSIARRLKSLVAAAISSSGVSCSLLSPLNSEAISCIIYAIWAPINEDCTAVI